jgi:hypothetical protein
LLSGRPVKAFALGTEYTEEDVTKIFKALEDEMTDCRKRFARAVKKEGGTWFALD